jgi:hypothetical protein
MIYSSSFAALLDANVLYPAPLRDFLLRLAGADFYQPKWTDQMQEEWIRNLLINRTDLTRENLERTKAAMNAAFPDANVTGYEAIIDSLVVPDPDDRHVVAAAIKSQADVLVTLNLKDFPVDVLASYELEVQHPDDFIAHMIGLDRPKVLAVIHHLVTILKRPPKTFEDILQTLEEQGLTKSVALLKNDDPVGISFAI